MKRLSWKFGLAAACGTVALLALAAPAFAAEEGRDVPVDRLERLERRVNDIAQRQEQFLRRLGVQQERQAPSVAPFRENLRRQIGAPGGTGVSRLTPPPGAPVPAAAPPAYAAKCYKDIAGLVKMCLLVGFIFNILLAIWIFTDIRKRGEGSGLFIALALLAGIPAAIIYSLVRIGDKKP
ncbi:MAG TPA: hypothetical protein PKI20_18150 [Verrucomicrobiota bacterium]|nr:hypothetical protein [Verrucomicrobiota bacterium]